MGIHEKFFLIEDNPSHAETAKRELEGAGHEMVGSANNFRDAVELVSKVEEYGATVIILDGNLHEIMEPREECLDGFKISRLIKKTSPNTLIVSHSGSNEEIANYGDITVSKQAPFGSLAKAVTAIPRSK